MAPSGTPLSGEPVGAWQPISAAPAECRRSVQCGSSDISDASWCVGVGCGRGGPAPKTVARDHDHNCGRGTPLRCRFCRGLGNGAEPGRSLHAIGAVSCRSARAPQLHESGSARTRAGSASRRARFRGPRPRRGPRRSPRRGPRARCRGCARRLAALEHAEAADRHGRPVAGPPGHDDRLLTRRRRSIGAPAASPPRTSRRRARRRSVAGARDDRRHAVQRRILSRMRWSGCRRRCAAPRFLAPRVRSLDAEGAPRRARRPFSRGALRPASARAGARAPRRVPAALARRRPGRATTPAARRAPYGPARGSRRRPARRAGSRRPS